MNCLTFETPFIITNDVDPQPHHSTDHLDLPTPHLLPRLLAPASCSPQHTHAASKLPFHLGTTSSPIRVHLATQPPRRCFISWSPLASPSSLIPRYHILAGAAENGPSAHAHPSLVLLPPSSHTTPRTIPKAPFTTFIPSQPPHPAAPDENVLKMRPPALPTARLLWAFDFDGVLCHSAKELCLTGWAAAREFWPGETQTWPERWVCLKEGRREGEKEERKG